MSILTAKAPPPRRMRSLDAIGQEPIEVRRRVAALLRGVALEIGDEDRYRAWSMEDAAHVLESGTFTDPGRRRR